MNQVTELHVHDHYSFLDGYNTPAEYMVRAKEIGMTHLAQTNHGTLAGHREFQRAAKEAGITPILGLEAYISETDRFDRRTKASRKDGTAIYNHIILLAQNETGLATLNRLSEKAWTEGFYSKPRIDTELLFEDNEGLIVLSGCLSGLVAKRIEAGDMVGAMNIAKGYKDILGDRFYIEVQGHNPVNINAGLFHVADKLGIKLVTTSDCHYARKDQLYMEEAMLIISTSPDRAVGVDLAKAQKMDLLDRYNYLYPNRKMTFQEFEIYLRSYEEHQNLYKAQGIDRTDMMENTMEIASRIGEYPYYQGLDILPKLEKDNPDDLLRKYVFDGLKKKGKDKDPVYVERANHELSIIEQKKFAMYFIILFDLIQFCDRENIVRGPGRGSAAGSIICWAMDVTEPDPIYYDLLFSRFIDLGRDDWPDVDLDFDDESRGIIKNYLTDRWTHVASIATFSYYKGKNTIKDAAKVTGVPLAETTRATKDNDAPADADYIDFFVQSEKGRDFAKKYPDTIKVARGLQGRIRQGGMHAAGVVISNMPLEEIAPVQTAPDPNDKKGPRIKYIALDMNEVAEIGGIKYDILGLKNLRIIQSTIESITERTGKKIDFRKIPLDDEEVYKMLQRGETQGVFQADGGAFTRWILDNKCEKFMDLVAGTSIARPGAKDTIGESYRKRLFGLEDINYANKTVHNITKETLGLVVYQEQVMQMMTDLAGMSSSDANKVRKIIGKKRDSSEFEAYREGWMKGAAPKIGEAAAAKLWKDFEAHAGYSFNKSHAVAYSLITYRTAWLKKHYPLEYMRSLLMAEEDKAKQTGYLITIKNMGIPVYLPHINESGIKAEIQRDGIRLGLSQIKYVSDGISKKLMAYRPFPDYATLYNKTNEKYSGLNSRMLDALNKVGAAEFPDNPRRGDEKDYYYEYLQIPSFSYENLPESAMRVVRKVEDYTEDDTAVYIGLVTEIKNSKTWSRINFVDETGSASAFAGPNHGFEKGHMYAMLVGEGSIVKYVPVEVMTEDSGMLSKYLYGKVTPPPEDRYRVMAFATRKTKAGKDMGTLIVMDEDGTLGKVMVWPNNYSRMFPYLTDDKVVNLELREMDDGTAFVHRMETTHGY